MKSPADEYADRLNMAPISETNELSEYFKKQVDREALRENLKLTIPQRMEEFERNMRMIYDFRRDLSRAHEHQRSIAAQREAGWKRNLVAIAEFEALLEERRKRGGPK